MRVTWNDVSPIDRVFDDVMGTMVGTATSPRPFEPAIDVKANDDEVTFVCDVPGVKADDLDITVEEHVLTIKGKRDFENRDGDQVLLGRAYGSFSRAFRLPVSVDDDRLSAELADGVLTIHLPKHPKAKPKKIRVADGKQAKPREEE